MPVAKITLTDLQSNQQYRGTIPANSIALGQSVEIHLEDGMRFRVAKLRGWVISDTFRIAYLIDHAGHRFKIVEQYKTVAG
jgi:hypothetical protein